MKQCTSPAALYGRPAVSALPFPGIASRAPLRPSVRLYAPKSALSALINSPCAASLPRSPSIRAGNPGARPSSAFEVSARRRARLSALCAAARRESPRQPDQAGAALQASPSPPPCAWPSRPRSPPRSASEASPGHGGGRAVRVLSQAAAEVQGVAGATSPAHLSALEFDLGELRAQVADELGRSVYAVANQVRLVLRVVGVVKAPTG